MKTKYLFFSFTTIGSLMLLLSVMRYHFIIPATWKVVRYGEGSVSGQQCSPGVCEIVFKLITTSQKVKFDIDTCVKTHYIVTSDLLLEYPLQSTYPAYVGKDYCEIHHIKDYDLMNLYLIIFGTIFIVLACIVCTMSYNRVKNKKNIDPYNIVQQIPMVQKQFDENNYFTTIL
jgi:hypothetical protein